MSSRRPARPSTWVQLRSSWIDRIVALVLAPVVGPVAGLLAFWVRCREGAPSFVALDRIGRDGTTFRMWKLRSMRAERADGAATGAIITSGDGDDRITPSGAVLRRWRLDELPQLWNVARGEMALFGPRPETPTLVDLDDQRWIDVLAVRPGVTGPTQLLVEQWEAEVLRSGTQEEVYATVVLPVKLAIDRWYVQRGTVLTDVQVACSMVERFVLKRADTWVTRIVRAEVPEAAAITRSPSS